MQRTAPSPPAASRPTPAIRRRQPHGASTARLGPSPTPGRLPAWVTDQLNRPNLPNNSPTGLPCASPRGTPRASHWPPALCQQRGRRPGRAGGRAGGREGASSKAGRMCAWLVHSRILDWQSPITTRSGRRPYVPPRSPLPPLCSSTPPPAPPVTSAPLQVYMLGCHVCHVCAPLLHYARRPWAVAAPAAHHCVLPHDVWLQYHHQLRHAHADVRP